MSTNIHAGAFVTSIVVEAGVSGKIVGTVVAVGAGEVTANRVDRGESVGNCVGVLNGA